MNTLFNKVFGGCDMKILNDPAGMRRYKKTKKDKPIRKNCCTDCDQLTSDNMCKLGALYGMKRCIRTPDGIEKYLDQLKRNK